jgi:hypothetical protein
MPRTVSACRAPPVLMTARISLPAHSLHGSDPGGLTALGKAPGMSRIPFATSRGILSVECTLRRPKALPSNEIGLYSSRMGEWRGDVRPGSPFLISRR